MRLCELRQKEIINICSCKSLGCPIDLDIDVHTSNVTALILPGCGRFCGFFGKDDEFRIPWSCIRQIGEDIILVDLSEEEHHHKK